MISPSRRLTKSSEFFRIGNLLGKIFAEAFFFFTSQIGPCFRIDQLHGFVGSSRPGKARRDSDH